MSGKIWYVCNATGANGADNVSPAGQQRTRPLLTTTQAVSNAAAGDTLQYLEGHVEDAVATAAISKAGLYLVSEGTPATRAAFTQLSNAVGISLSAAGTRIDNFTFRTPAVTLTGGNSALSVGNTNILVANCSFSVGAGAAQSVRIGNSGARFIGCTFTSTATSVATRPASALTVSGALSDCEFDTCTVDGGTYGWSDYALNFGSAQTRLFMIDCDFLADSDLFLATGSVYRIHRRNVSGSSWLELTA